MMLLNKRGHEGAVGGEGSDGGDFIVAHEAAVALDVGAEDGGELAGERTCGRGLRRSAVVHGGDYATWRSGLSNGIPRAVYSSSCTMNASISRINRGRLEPVKLSSG